MADSWPDNTARLQHAIAWAFRWSFGKGREADGAPLHVHSKAPVTVLYLRSLKETLEPEDAIMILDYAENYSFIVQDAVQGFHRENSQSTLHPFVAYFLDNDQLQHLSICVISDCLKQDTIIVHRFLQDILPHLKDRCPQIN